MDESRNSSRRFMDGVISEVRLMSSIGKVELGGGEYVGRRLGGDDDEENFLGALDPCLITR